MTHKITIWTLNMAANLLNTKQQEIISLFKDYGFDAQFGQRPDTQDLAINLMPGTEYFVPIAPKCIGDLFDKEQNDILMGISKYYKAAGQVNYKEFWDYDGRDYKMLSAKYKGYYSILRESESNFLIGYSQGGLAARYLLWLAEDVFKEPGRVKGIITVSSPNFGSPLGNPDNVESIILGFLEIIITIFLPGKDEKAAARDLSSDVSLDTVSTTIKTLIERLGKRKNQSLSVSQKEKLTILKGILRELYNWIGGLRNDPNNAFYDLNIFRMNSPEPNYSVLSSINKTNPAKTIRGIISTDNSVSDILKDLFLILIEELIDILKECMKTNKKMKALMNEDALLKIEDYKKLSRVELRNKINKIQHIINNQIMMEHPSQSIKNPIIQDTINNYKNGISSLKIKAEAHDFVIPSAYQLTKLKDTIPVNCNTPNFKANHLSGSDLKYKAGRDNYKDIRTELTKMLKKGI
ncbi:MAG: hypothetical protein JXJ04_26975 [Spirochaetales bacterium]|nr:hypothetical protein [Spirochaetales bacterium]